MLRKTGGRRADRFLPTFVLLLFVLATIGLIGASPIALGLFQGATGDWERLSFIGQTYGDLLKMAMEDPDLDECWGPVPPPADPRTRKQRLYTNMIVAEWAMSFETGTLHEPRLRLIAHEMFQGHESTP